jgi:nucleoside-diphosphate-sugar epimerase
VINRSAKSVLVAGASGYVGKAVVAELVEQGFEVYAVVRKNTELKGSKLSNLNIIAIDTEPIQIGHKNSLTLML